MKKFNVFLLSFLTVLVCTGALAFSACAKNENVAEKFVLKAEHIALEFYETSYNGQMQTPQVSVRVKAQTISSAEYTVHYENNINVGVAKVVVVANKNSRVVAGTAERTFEIKKADLNASMIGLEYQTTAYTSTAKTPALFVNIGGTIQSLDGFNISYKNNIEVGTATAIIEAKETNPNVCGKVEIDFEITKIDFENAVVKIEYQQIEYSTYPAEPQVLSVTLFGKTIDPSTYSIRYTNNSSIGTAQVIVEANPNNPYLVGETHVDFEITKATLLPSMFSVLGNNFVYNGSAQTPQVSMLFNGYNQELNEYFVVEYKNNTNAGTAQITISATQHNPTFAGSATLYFVIEKAEISADMIELSSSVFEYTGYEKQPSATINFAGTVVDSSEYSVSYQNNIDAGTATATIAIKSTSTNFKGTVDVEFEITPTTLVPGMLKLEFSEATYTGEEICPTISIVIGDKTITSFTIQYFDNIEPGTARVVVTANANSNITGSATITFVIKAAETQV